MGNPSWHFVTQVCCEKNGDHVDVIFFLTLLNSSTSVCQILVFLGIHPLFSFPVLALCTLPDIFRKTAWLWAMVYKALLGVGVPLYPCVQAFPGLSCPCSSVCAVPSTWRAFSPRHHHPSSTRPASTHPSGVRTGYTSSSKGLPWMAPWAGCPSSDSLASVLSCWFTCWGPLSSMSCWKQGLSLSVTTVSVALFLTVSKICVDCMNENFPPIYWVALAQEKLRDKNMQDLQATFWNEESLRVLSLNWLMEGVASEALRGCPWLFSPLFSTRPPTTFQVSQMCISLLCKVHESRIYNFIFAYTCCLAHSRYLIVKWNEWNLKKGRHTASSDKTIHSVSNIFSVESLLPLAQPLLSYICIVLLLFKLLSHPLSDFILTFTLRSMQFRSHYLPVTTY